MKRILLGTLLGISVASVSGVAQAGPPAGGAAPASRVFTLRLPAEPETLDWNRAHTPIETYVLMNLMEGLVAFDDKLNVVPSLAQSWSRSEDGRTYTFKIRPGVKWSDGVALKAQDFVYSWKRLLSPITAAPYAYLLFDIEGAEYFYNGKLQDFSEVGVKALDDLTFQVKLARPVAHWIYVPTFWVTYPLRQDVVEKHGSSWEKPGRMVSVGPFTLAVHDIDSKIVMKANPQYWGKRGNVDEVVGLIVTDNSTALSLYEAGKFDFMTDISTLDLKRLQGRPDLKTYPYLKTGYPGFATDKFPVTNARVRKAIAMAIDKTKLVQVLGAGQQPATSFVPPGIMAFSKTIGLPFDPMKAKAELRASGIDLARPLKLEIGTMNGDKQITLATFLQNELKKNLGIDATVEQRDHKTYRAQLDLRAFPVFVMSWSADFPDPDNYLSVFLADSGNNRTGWKNPAFDDRVQQARILLDPKARERAYSETQKTLLDEAAVIVPLYYEPNMALVRARVQGLELNPLNYLYLKKVTLR